MKYREVKFNEIEKFHGLLAAFCSETNADDDALSIVLKRLEEGRTFTFGAEEHRGRGLAKEIYNIVIVSKIN